MLKKLQELPATIRNSKPVKWIEQRLKRIFLPGFEGLPLYDVLTFFFRGIQKGALTTRASAISFTIFLALLPSSILILSLVSYIPVDNIDDELVSRFSDLLPASVFHFIEGAMGELIGRKHNTVLSIGFVLTAYYASSSINSILMAFNNSYHLTARRNPIKQRLIAFMLIIALAALIMIAVVLMTFSDFFFDWLRTNHYVEGSWIFAILHLSKWTLIVLIFMFAISLLYNFGTPGKKSLKVVTAGSTLATILAITVSWGFAWYVTHFGQWNKIYGSLGTVIVLCLWIYFNAIILLIGFELNTSIASAKKQHIKMLTAFRERQEEAEAEEERLKKEKEEEIARIEKENTTEEEEEDVP